MKRGCTQPLKKELLLKPRFGEHVTADHNQEKKEKRNMKKQAAKTKTCKNRGEREKVHVVYTFT